MSTPASRSSVALIILLIAGVAGCGDDALSPRDPHLPDTVITLARGPCFGACPVYRVTIASTGKLVYDGEMFVGTEGQVVSSITHAQLEQLISAFLDIGYFELNDSYGETHDDPECETWATDLPSATTSLRHDGQFKSVYDYHGCFGSQTLDELRELERMIDEVVGTDRWVARDSSPVILGGANAPAGKRDVIE